MAQVIRTPATRQRIDASLDFALNEWRGVPELADEWTEWESVERLTFRYAWAIREDHLDQLAQWRARALHRGAAGAARGNTGPGSTLQAHPRCAFHRQLMRSGQDYDGAAADERRQR
jgi:hypothetical protein